MNCKPAGSTLKHLLHSQITLQGLAPHARCLPGLLYGNISCTELALAAMLGIWNDYTTVHQVCHDACSQACHDACSRDCIKSFA